MKREKSDGTAAGKRVNMQKPRASMAKEFVHFNVLHNYTRRATAGQWDRAALQR